MQEQNFEKQVQQKMDELSLTPSAPVWQKVQSEIGQKKERRRLVLWASSFLLLLLAGGWWLFSVSNKFPIISATTSQASNKPNIKNGYTEDQINSNERSTQNTISNPSSVNSTKENITNSTATLQHHFTDKNVASLQYKMAKNPTRNTHDNADRTQETGNAINLATPSTRNNQKNEKHQQKEQVQSTSTNSSDEITASITTSSANPSALTLAKDSISPMLSDSTMVQQNVDENSDSALLPGNNNAQPKSKKKRQWVWTGQLAYGSTSVKEKLFSGMAQALNSFSPTNAPNPSADAAPSKPGSTYSIGGGIKAPLSKRLAFTAGLQYSYFSTKVRVGHSVLRDTIIQGATTFRINSFFQSGQMREYTNRYHFIELPIGLEWRVHQKLPLYLHSGISFSRMISSNALVFDRNAGIYYKDKQNLQVNQMHAFSGLHFQFLKLKKVSIQAGPYLQYGLSNLQKGNTTDKLHLISTVIRTKFTFL
ncbi:MAG TPA: hypothetical protein VEY32_06080 [Flavisolibacter sp.]|nr:hypothetical protein [Flavisolibacter sp.]